MTAPLAMSSEPTAPDQVAVPLLFNVRKKIATFADAGKLIPAFALVVALVPPMQLPPLSVEHIVPPDQFNTLEKFRIPGAAPAKIPPVKFILEVEMVSVPVPKSIVAPLKFTVPAPLIAPLCPNTLLAKLIAAPGPAVNIPEQVDPQFPPPVKDRVPLLPSTVPVLLKLRPIVVVAAPPVFSNVPALLNTTAVPPPKARVLSLV